jgi:hypothetical protein
MGEEHSSEPESISDWAMINPIAARDEAAFVELYGR